MQSEKIEHYADCQQSHPRWERGRGRRDEGDAWDGGETGVELGRQKRVSPNVKAEFKLRLRDCGLSIAAFEQTD